MRILVTGATGFIGSHFARLARSRGHELAGLATPGKPLAAHLPHPGEMTWFRGTLRAPPWAEIKAWKAEVCVHSAWITTPGVYLESPENHDFERASLEFLRELAWSGTGHIFGLGTCVEYQPTGQPLNEERSAIAPATTYARCKNQLRIALEADAQARGHLFSWGRVFYPYGPGEHPARLCSSIIVRLNRGEKVFLKTPESTKDYIHIEDLAAALLAVVERRHSGPINLGTGQGVTVRDLARTLGELLGRGELIEEKFPPDVDPLGSIVADAARLRSLGWKPTLTLRQGLELMVK